MYPTAWWWIFHWWAETWSLKNFNLLYEDCCKWRYCPYLCVLIPQWDATLKKLTSIEAEFGFCKVIILANFHWLKDAIYFYDCDLNCDYKFRRWFKKKSCLKTIPVYYWVQLFCNNKYKLKSASLFHGHLNFL